jgi:hypothetical protein
LLGGLSIDSLPPWRPRRAIVREIGIAALPVRRVRKVDDE